MSGVWKAYQDAYDSLQATCADPNNNKQLFDVGAAIADKDFAKAIKLAEQLRRDTIIPGQISLGWAPTLALDELLRELQVLD